MWNEIQNTYFNHGVVEQTNIPENILKDIDLDITIDEKYLNGLWVHQKSILKWMVKRNNMIINIPPGCGKTKIAMSYIKYLFDIENNMVTVVLAPTKTLVEQWLDRLRKEKIQCYEWDTNLSGLDEFFANPERKAIVTLYSRFYEKYRAFNYKMKIIKPNIVTICDECHNIYEHINDIENYKLELLKNNMATYNID